MLDSDGVQDSNSGCWSD